MPNIFKKKSLFYFYYLRELDIGRYLPKSIVESNILPKEDLKKLLIQNLSWFMEKTDLIQDKTNIKMEYLSTIKELFQFSGRIFFVFLLVKLENFKFGKLNNIFFLGSNERGFYNYWC